MRRYRLLLAGILLAATWLLAAPAAALSAREAAEPPNQNDPCASGGRNTCGTTGVGSYETYRYGIRWFGDYRGAIVGEGRAFCIDLRFWYPDRDYNFRELDDSSGLRNRDGRSVSLASQRRMAYAIWSFGRSTSRNQQAAVMLYVHALMGDAEPGEVARNAIGGTVAGIYDRVAREASRLHGPYRIQASLPDDLTIARPATGTIRVLSASGAALPNTTLRLRTTGASGVPASVTTNAAGVARISFRPTSTEGVGIAIESEPLASTLPRFFVPSTPGAARNGQRLAVPGSQRVTERIERSVGRSRVRVTTEAQPKTLLVGEQSRDKVTIAGLPDGRRAQIGVRAFGPFRTRQEIVCTGRPAFQGDVIATESGELLTPAATFGRPGIYTYQLSIPETDAYPAVLTPCGEPSETFRVEVQPRVTTVVSSGTIRPGQGQELFDRVMVSGLAGEPAQVAVLLYGPFPTREAIKCDGTPIQQTTLAVLEGAPDGEYTTVPIALTAPGYYTYVESIPATGFVRTTATACGDIAETSIVVATPQVRTQVSEQQTTPGSQITDQVIVTGLGALTAEVQVELWGPFPTRESIVCSGTPFATSTFTAEGDGTYTTEPVTLTQAGFYTYVERLAGSEANDAVATACGEASETTFARAAPRVTTIASADVVRAGSQIFDRVRVTGLGQTQAEVEVDLFGPFATRDRINCAGTPVATVKVTANGDGEYRSPPVTISRVGFYTFRERLIGSPAVRATEGACAVTAETSLGAPEITTGRGEIRVRPREQGAAGPSAPTRLRIPQLSIDAPIQPVGIDIARGELAVPANIQRLAFWRDGMRPGASAGSILIAGHVDSARAGAGALFRLPRARAGQRVQVTTADGRTRSYRVVSVQSVPKPQLPPSVYSQRGPARLSIVTCGGPFDTASGTYRNNIIVTAVPA